MEAVGLGVAGGACDHPHFEPAAAVLVEQGGLADFGNAGALFLEMMGAGKLSDGMTERMHRSMRGPLPGYYPAGTSPVKLWDR